MKRLFKLNPEKNLTHQWPFWIINGALFAIAVILTFLIVNKGNYYTDWSPAGFKLFLSDFGFPISISALIIPASALIATMHRSSQLSTQINLLMDQNNFANYYKHYEEFGKYIEKAIVRQEDLDLIKKNELRIYRSIFPDSRNGIYSPSVKVFKETERIIWKMIDGYVKLKLFGGDLWDYIREVMMEHENMKELTCIGFKRINIVELNRIGDVEKALDCLFRKMRSDISLILEVSSYERLNPTPIKKWEHFKKIEISGIDSSKISFVSLSRLNRNN